ncbi:Holliday junction resolvase RuvX [Candidatus Parcubacteria bacterium]|nr:Holliday junction resolvase RuvX [Candidatus Parcubacteria bacterium]
MRYLGIDFGTKKVGLALSDEAGTMGFPHSVIVNTKELPAVLEEIIVKEKVDGVVIGESVDFSGQENLVAREARALGECLHSLTELPIFYETELLTTQEARRDLEGNRTDTGVVDAKAAALILTSYLSKHHGNT